MPTRDDIIAALKTIEDPELFIDIWTLGLIYDIAIEDQSIGIKMTFTSMACPAGPYLVEQVQLKLRGLPEVEKVDVEVVFQPPWTPSDELKMMLGID
jgi:metal-sulfur cluster biosynthetic enzyme